MRTRSLFVAAMAAASLLAACGSDSSTSKPATTDAAGTDTTAAGGTDTTAAGGTDTTGPKDTTVSGGVSSDPDIVAYCAQIQTYKDKANSFDDVFTAATPDPKATEAAFTTMQAMLGDLAENAPSDIKADVETVKGSTQKLIDLFAKYEWDLTKLATAGEDFTALQTIMTDASVATASANLDKFGQEQCGFAPGS